MRIRTRALVRREPDPTPEQLAANPTLIFERLAKDKNVDVGKLERLIAMQERVMAIQAKAAFDEAFGRMQMEIPEIDAKGAVRNKAGEIQSRYSTNPDIQRIIKPILHKYGFSIRFRSEWPDPGVVKVVGILTHGQGHSEQSEFRSEADTSGNKNSVQALGSVISYGHRYTTKDVCNIIDRSERNDDDGQSGGARRRAPAGEPPVHHDKSENELITDKQRRRLWVIIRKAGREELDVKAWLAVAYGVDSTRKITRRYYEEICNAVEKPGPLPKQGPAIREPGEEG